jgi:tRNA dimethylallyltransferase
VGKTAVAVRVAEALGGEIVSADSRQVYRGMKVGSGAPTGDELARAKHHLVGEISPEARLSAGEYARLARERVNEIRARGKLPIVVGGSGLYVRALVDGLAPIPPHSPKLRQAIETDIEHQGMKVMIEKLAAVDPDYATKVGLRDRKRLVRALEVYRLTGRRFSDWHSLKSDEWCQPMFFGLARPRWELKILIEKRVRAMMAAGWLEELKQLAQQFGGLSNLPPAVTEALGYRQLLNFVEGGTVWEETITRIIIATRQFAKRQMTWFRADARVVWREETGEGAMKRWGEWLEGELSEQAIK